MVEVIGASGKVNIPLSKFVYLSDDKPEPEPKPEDNTDKKSLWGAFTIIAIIIIVLVVAGLAFVMIRRSMAKDGYDVTSELDALERSGEYTIHKTRDEDSIHLKKD